MPAMPRLRLETQDRDKNHEFGFNEWSENMITMPEQLASISAFGPGRNVVRREPKMARNIINI